MFKNYWLRRKAIREDAMIIYRLVRTPECPDIKVEIPPIPAPEKKSRWKDRANFYDRLKIENFVI